MLVETIKCLEDNFSYVLIDKNKNACVVDPSEPDPIINLGIQKTVREPLPRPLQPLPRQSYGH